MTTNTAVEPASSHRPAALWARLVGTFFGVGHIRPGPGTWASLATVVVWRVAASWLPPAAQAPVALAVVVVGTAAGLPAAPRVAEACGKEDPSQVVIDEVAGQMLTLAAAPLGWKSLLAGLILFRAFDILKPPPLRRLERLPAGFGIMADDLGAGLGALAVMQALLHFGVI